MQIESKSLVSVNKPKIELETSHSIPQIQEPIKNKQPIEILEVKEGGQLHILLEDYDVVRSSKSYVIYITPSPESDAIVAQVTRLKYNDQYRLILHVANYGNKTVNAEVWRL